MFGYRFLRSAAIALSAYGLLGLAIAAAMLVVGISSFGQVTSLQKTLESERVSLVQSIRTVSGTLHDTAGATTNFQQSIDGARIKKNPHVDRRLQQPLPDPEIRWGGRPRLRRTPGSGCPIGRDQRNRQRCRWGRQRNKT